MTVEIATNLFYLQNYPPDPFGSPEILYAGVQICTPETAVPVVQDRKQCPYRATARQDSPGLIILLKFGTLMGEFIVMALVKYSLVKVINMLIRFNRL